MVLFQALNSHTLLDWWDLQQSVSLSLRGKSVYSAACSLLLSSAIFCLKVSQSARKNEERRAENFFLPFKDTLTGNPSWRQLLPNSSSLFPLPLCLSSNALVSPVSPEITWFVSPSKGLPSRWLARSLDQATKPFNGVFVILCFRLTASPKLQLEFWANALSFFRITSFLKYMYI